MVSDVQPRIEPLPDSGMARCFEAIPEHPGYWADLEQGALPPDLEGTLFRNGPSLFKLGGEVVEHPLDGDGMVSAYTFVDGGLFFRNRYVRTREFVAEQKAGQRMFRGLGTPRPGGVLANAFRTKIKNCANTNVVFHGGHLLALWEGGQPYRLDPATLHTLGGEYDYEGGLGFRYFSAHPAIDPRTGDLYNFGPPYHFTGGRAVMSLTRVDASGKVVQVEDIELPRRFYFHDLALTDRYVVLHFGPMWLKMLPFVLGFASPVPALEWKEGQPSLVLLVDRQTLKPIRYIEGPPGFAFHDLNAFDDGDELIVDYAFYDGNPRWWAHTSSDWTERQLGHGVRPFPVRFRIDPARGLCHSELLADVPMEMCSIHPAHAGRPYRYVYGLGSLFPRSHSVVKLDVQTRRAQVRDFGPDGYPEEPLFVRRAGGGGEDHGYLVFPVLREKQRRTELWVLDASDLEKAPVAVAALRHHVPISFHGSFVPRVFIPERPR